MIEREVLLEVDIETDFWRGWFFGREDLEDFTSDEFEEEFSGGDAVVFFASFAFVTSFDEVLKGLAAVFVLSGEDMKDEGKGDSKGGGEGFGGRVLEFVECFFIPVNIAFFGGCFFDDFFLFSGSCFGFEFEVFDDVLWGLGYDVTDVVEAASSSTSGDLFEVTDWENDGAFAVVFTQLGEDDCSDGDIDSDAEGVGSADDFEEAALSEFFD